MELCKFWGWFMNSSDNANAFADALKAAHSLNPDGISYLEIGLGNCGTINAIDFMLAQLPGAHSITGIEVEGWTQKYLTPLRSNILIGGREVIPSQGYDVVLIDGCHCKECVKADFEATRTLVPSGGLVIFHDTDESCQGLHKDSEENPHQKNGIEVLSALNEIDFTGWTILHQTCGHPPDWHGLRIYVKD